MRIFKHRIFQKWMNSEALTDENLRQAIHELESGLHDGNLGSNLYKKRIAMPGQGKRGSYRTLLAFKSNEKTFALYGFSKNSIGNINRKEKSVYKLLSKQLLDLNESALTEMLKLGTLLEIKNE